MSAKLTLTIEQQVIDTAKVYARNKGRSLSELVETYLKSLTSSQQPEGHFSPRVKRLMGSINLPKDFDYKKTLAENLSQKHLG